MEVPWGRLFCYAKELLEIKSFAVNGYCAASENVIQRGSRQGDGSFASHQRFGGEAKEPSPCLVAKMVQGHATVRKLRQKNRPLASPALNSVFLLLRIISQLRKLNLQLIVKG